ncbi:EKC/KEOPS complex subunit TPRKB isoform X3 [Scyliorhinus canicula]|uniref:EKC/KEOPS complex subunit TPRKB isoform X3 n=1 Tax=Scyliorhinus canicula TaxID=7830 RepID=UPI0018F37ED9|nr:EKC/KEOPS complex subunit TPRKB isoform X3 [Scyliorhinus canicula]
MMFIESTLDRWAFCRSLWYKFLLRVQEFSQDCLSSEELLFLAMDKMIMTHELKLFPGCTVTLLLFKDVKNAAELRKKAVEGAIDGALINASMISDAFRKFGISDSDTAVLVVLVDDGKSESHLEDIIRQVEGQQICVQDISSIADVAKIKKVLQSVSS